MEEEIGKTNLEVCNMIMSGRLPVIRKFKEEEIRKIIDKSKLIWQIVNEEISPIMQTRFIQEGTSLRSHNKKEHNSVVSLWATGKINICGLRNEADGHKYYNEVLYEIRKLCKGVFEDGKRTNNNKQKSIQETPKGKAN